MNDYAEQVRADVACRDCASEVRVTVGSDPYRPYRARVIHTAACPWFPRYEAGTLDPRTENTGCVPCSTQVVHRGPYKRDPERRPA